MENDSPLFGEFVRANQSRIPEIVSALLLKQAMKTFQNPSMKKMFQDEPGVSLENLALLNVDRREYRGGGGCCDCGDERPLGNGRVSVRNIKVPNRFNPLSSKIVSSSGLLDILVKAERFLDQVKQGTDNAFKKYPLLSTFSVQILTISGEGNEFASYAFEM
ncbi:hypothetical protein F2Q69_00044225 [Brassica cretica]|uniref:Uncharacterized protein n=1 Tax=Brassica cretica TaxID=69181 RepID=A0A8S9NDJ2_BRACR|nr:hypothetical protein F2Q69_00044225 [Brassica cretica]